MKSIMGSRKGECYLCRIMNDGIPTHYDIYTEEHHVIMGNANKRLSEKFGLKIYLCKNHHTDGKDAVHRNYETCRLLQMIAQRIFERTYPELDFVKIFGRNYL